MTYRVSLVASHPMNNIYFGGRDVSGRERDGRDSFLLTTDSITLQQDRSASAHKNMLAVDMYQRFIWTESCRSRLFSEVFREEGLSLAGGGGLARKPTRYISFSQFLWLRTTFYAFLVSGLDVQIFILFSVINVHATHCQFLSLMSLELLVVSAGSYFFPTPLCTHAKYSIPLHQPQIDPRRKKAHRLVS